LRSTQSPRRSERLALERFAQVHPMSHHGIELVAMQFAFPVADHERGKAIADQIGQTKAARPRARTQAGNVNSRAQVQRAGGVVSEPPEVENVQSLDWFDGTDVLRS